jgi:hypothetical protein
MLKIFSTSFDACMNTSEHGLPHPFKGPGAVANGLTGRPEAGPVFAHGTTGAKRTVGAPPVHKSLQNKNAKLCNIVTATSLLN